MSNRDAMTSGRRGTTADAHGDVFAHRERHAERLGDALGGDVVMGGADATGGQDVVEGRSRLIDGVDDDLLDIRNHACFAHAHTAFTEYRGDVVQISVLGATGQDLVADDQHAGGIDAFSHAPQAGPFPADDAISSSRLNAANDIRA